MLLWAWLRGSQMSVMAAAGLSSRKCRRRSSSQCRLVVAVAPADVGPLRPIACPYPAPAAVIIAVVGVVGVGEGNTNECKAVEAVMEEAVIECAVRKAR